MFPIWYGYYLRSLRQSVQRPLNAKISDSVYWVTVFIAKLVPT